MAAGDEERSPCAETARASEASDGGVMRHRVLCAHADRNGEGAHWMEQGERCAEEYPAGRRYMIEVLGMTEAEAQEFVRLCTSADPDTVEEVRAGVSDLLDRVARLDGCVEGCSPDQCDHSSSGGRCDVCGTAKP